MQRTYARTSLDSMHTPDPTTPGYTYVRPRRDHASSMHACVPSQVMNQAQFNSSLFSHASRWTDIACSVVTAVAGTSVRGARSHYTLYSRYGCNARDQASWRLEYFSIHRRAAVSLLNAHVYFHQLVSRSRAPILFLLTRIRSI